MKHKFEKVISYTLVTERDWDLFKCPKNRRSIEPMDPASNRAYQRILWVIEKPYAGGVADVHAYSISPDYMKDVDDVVA